MAEADSTALQKFIAQETQLFYAHIASATQKFEESGELQHSLFKAQAVRALLGKKGKVAGSKRKLTAFNIFVGERLGKLKTKDDPRPHNEKFKSVVAEWGALSDEQKKHYTEKYAAQIAASGADVAAEGGVGAAVESSTSSEDAPPATEERKKKKKKEKHHKHHKDSD